MSCFGYFFSVINEDDNLAQHSLINFNFSGSVRVINIIFVPYLIVDLMPGSGVISIDLGIESFPP